MFLRGFNKKIKHADCRVRTQDLKHDWHFNIAAKLLGTRSVI